MKTGLEFAQKFSLAYGAACKPLCRELKLPQTAFDILMFLANNPEYKTASDIVEIRKIKANLVSVNVNKLVEEEYLRRESVKGDRRKTQLVCTEKAQPVIEKGRILQNGFLERLFKDRKEEERNAFFHMMQEVSANLDDILEGRD